MNLLQVTENFDEDGNEDGTYAVTAQGPDLNELYDDDEQLESAREAEAFAQEWSDAAAAAGMTFEVQTCTDVKVYTSLLT